MRWCATPCTASAARAAAEAAASIAAATGTLAGLRDAALIRVGSDALLRVSELAALQVADVEAHPDGSGMLTVRSSKTDQEGRGALRYLGTPTVAAVTRWLQAAGIAAGPLWRPLHTGASSADRLGAGSIRAVIRRRASVVDGIPDRVSGHSLRVGSAQSPVLPCSAWRTCTCTHSRSRRSTCGEALRGRLLALTTTSSTSAATL